MEFYPEDPVELLPELYEREESRDDLARELEAVCKAQSEPARLVLVFKNEDDRTRFMQGLLTTPRAPEDRRDAERPIWSLVKNWRTSGGDDVPL